MRKELLLMIGVQGSGKSTKVNQLLKEKYWQVVCLDDIRRALGDIFNPRAESFVAATNNIMVRAHMERSLPVIVDATNVSMKIVEMYKALAEEYDYEFNGMYMAIPLDVCLERKLGINKLTREVFDRTYTSLNEFMTGGGFTLFDNLTIIDLVQQEEEVIDL